jgi:hypothetical protein
VGEVKTLDVGEDLRDLLDLLDLRGLVGWMLAMIMAPLIFHYTMQLPEGTWLKFLAYSMPDTMSTPSMLGKIPRLCGPSEQIKLRLHNCFFRAGWIQVCAAY